MENWMEQFYSQQVEYMNPIYSTLVKRQKGGNTKSKVKIAKGG